MRKIRKTNDLRCLISPAKDENTGAENNKLFTRNNEKIDNTSSWQALVDHECAADIMKERKIIKAKRILQNCNKNKKKVDQQLKPQRNKKKEFVTLGNTNSDIGVESKYCHIDLQESITLSMIDSVQQNKTSCGKKIDTSSAEEEASSTLNLISSETCSNTLSPSFSNTEKSFISPKLGHLHFNSSQELLYPSTSGNVRPLSRQRTFELENSVTNISLLKCLSEEDSFRVNSSLTDVDCNTPREQTYSKVTLRRKWNKAIAFSQCSDGPAWSNSHTKTKSDKEMTPPLKEQNVFQKGNSSSSAKKNISKVKIPNFALIHEKALSKIESITEYKERKEHRAKMLLSGRKPAIAPQSSQKTITSYKKENRKQLRFAPETTSKEKSPTFIPLPSTPIPRYVIPESKKSFVAVKPFVFGNERNAVLKTAKEYQTSVTENKLNNYMLMLGNKEIPISKPLDSYNVLTNKNMFTLGKKEVPISKPLQSYYASMKTKSNGVDMKNLKSILTKNKPAPKTLESRRFAIKGVRSNRRFELLMNMRKGK